jgi:hypothetical protein
VSSLILSGRCEGGAEVYPPLQRGSETLLGKEV